MLGFQSSPKTKHGTIFLEPNFNWIPSGHKRILKKKKALHLEASYPNISKEEKEKKCKTRENSAIDPKNPEKKREYA